MESQEGQKLSKETEEMQQYHFQYCGTGLVSPSNTKLNTSILALRNYSYVSDDQSIFSYLLTPFWDFLANCTPKWMAPNVLTLMGLLCSVIAFLWLVVFHNELRFDSEANGHSVPSYVYYWCTILLFAYQTIDAVDGKHARNLKRMSALGELFDHGGDALAMSCTSCLLSSTVELGSTIYTLLFFGFLYVASYLTVWEDYVTDVMRFGKLNGPTEALLIANAVIAITGYFGSQMWNHNVTPFLPTTIQQYVPKEFSIKQALVNFGICIAFSTITQSVIYVLKAAGTEKLKKEKGGPIAAAKALIPFFGTLILFLLNALCNYNVFVQQYTFLFHVCFGLVASYVQTRLIFARITKQKMPIFFSIHFPLFVITSISVYAYFFNWTDWSVFSINILQFYFVYVVYKYVHFVYYAYEELRIILNLRMFSLEPRNKSIKTH